MRHKIKTKSTLDRSRTGRMVLTVHYPGRAWDEAIQQALREHGFSEGDDVTVIALPL